MSNNEENISLINCKEKYFDSEIPKNYTIEDVVKIEDNEANIHEKRKSSFNQTKIMENEVELNFTPRSREGNCILCCDYQSPICSNCETNQNKLQCRLNLKNNSQFEYEKIIPNGKVKALAKQFEEIIPDGKLNIAEYNNLVINEHFQFNKISDNINSTSICELCESDFDIKSLYLQSPSNSYLKSIKSPNKLKNQLTRLKNPDLCESIDPIEALVLSQKVNVTLDRNMVDMYRKESDSPTLSYSLRSLLSTSGAKICEVIAEVNEEPNKIPDRFEDLNPLEQRALLITWITSSLGTNKITHSPSKVREMMSILKEIVEDLEDPDTNFALINSSTNGHLTSPNFNDKSNLCDHLRLHNNNKNYQLRHIYVETIPEDEELVENINVCDTKSTELSKIQISLHDYAESVIAETDGLSPKSDISLTNATYYDIICKNSHDIINNIGIDFLGLRSDTEEDTTTCKHINEKSSHFTFPSNNGTPRNITIFSKDIEFISTSAISSLSYASSWNFLMGDK
ncbi:uncharacterized protein CMU_022940 [Cryptosporidium muris RN66]|uniref:Uncharacterized protein n=1 Tax=Cryptosporidium muris (strain RN66) TaxID=441375 RepID=B6ABT6_CRYMR|nr:uncharacterized protein CMU_022940 [Cryptosporidium muris RN66]EEA05289.1 hypothetical protein, conserved [Cryptosporidium muris RN66]|eukprot:XP_002139638.1 hypothetical protein [Cryptosporidium muris RN66]